MTSKQIGMQYYFGENVLRFKTNCLNKIVFNLIRASYFVNFCVRLLAKDQGITQVVVVILVLHWSHFLFKRYLSEKNSSEPWGS